jgi:hypothetical protein
MTDEELDERISEVPTGELAKSKLIKDLGLDGPEEEAAIVVLDELAKCAEALRDKVTTAQFARGACLFAATFTYGCAPSPMHATKILIAAMDAAITEEVDGFNAWSAENECEDEDETKPDGKDGQ